MLITALAVAASITTGSILVSPEALEALETPIVIDVRPEDDYLEARIPGALHIDVAALSAPTDEGVVNILRPYDEVTRELYAAGLDPARTTVIYGAFGEGDDLLDAARMFWILEVLGWEDARVLDGGFPNWLEAGLDIESGPAAEVTPPANPPAPRLLRQRMATKEDVERVQEAGGAALIDARGVGYFEGTEQSEHVERAGHIPGAVNLPGSSFADFEGLSFLSVDLIRNKIESGGVSVETPAITYCNTGRSASVGYLAARIAGMEHVAVYDGSMAEWSADASCEVEAPVSEDAE